MKKMNPIISRLKRQQKFLVRVAYYALLDEKQMSIEDYENLSIKEKQQFHFDACVSVNVVPRGSCLVTG